MGEKLRGVHGAEPGSLIVADAGAIADRRSDAPHLPARTRYRDDVVAGGDVVEYGGSGLRKRVERGVDVAESGRGLRTIRNQVLIQHGSEPGVYRSRHGGAAKSTVGALRVDEVAIVIGRSGGGDIGHVARVVAGHTRSGL